LLRRLLRIGGGRSSGLDVSLLDWLSSSSSC
jgi:hypothetical protein